MLWESKLIIDIAHNYFEICIIFIYFTFFGITFNKLINKGNTQIPDSNLKLMDGNNIMEGYYK